MSMVFASRSRNSSRLDTSTAYNSAVDSISTSPVSSFLKKTLKEEVLFELLSLSSSTEILWSLLASTSLFLEGDLNSCKTCRIPSSISRCCLRYSERLISRTISMYTEGGVLSVGGTVGVVVGVIEVSPLPEPKGLPSPLVTSLISLSFSLAIATRAGLLSKTLSSSVLESGRRSVSRVEWPKLPVFRQSNW